MARTVADLGPMHGALHAPHHLLFQAAKLAEPGLDIQPLAA